MKCIDFCTLHVSGKLIYNIIYDVASSIPSSYWLIDTDIANLGTHCATMVYNLSNFEPSSVRCFPANATVVGLISIWKR